MALPRPSPSEADLYNLPTAARLAYVIDQLIAMNTALGGVTGITPVDLEASVVAAGPAAVTTMTGPTKGGYITNPETATQQGIGAAENLYVSLTGVPTAVDANANGGVFVVKPGGSFIAPALATGATLKVISATAGHKFAGVKYT